MGEEKKCQPPGAVYSMPVGLVYCFNLMMGAGLLALPKAFVQVGWILGLCGVTILAFVSYCTVTFIIEAQSVHNALQLNTARENSRGNRVAPNGQEEVELDDVVPNKHASNGHVETEENIPDKDENVVVEGTNTAPASPPPASSDNDNHVDNSMVNSEAVAAVEDNPGVYLYEITTKTTLGELSKLFLNKFGYVLYYLAICLYLFGSLSIYVAAISKSLASIVCDDHESFHSGNTSISCKTIPKLSVMQTYRISLGIFVVLCCPFTFFTITKTKLLQLSTMAFRCFALTSMIVLALIKIIKGKGFSTPKLADFSKLPDFISTSIYAFMCQYSVPAVITPIKNKKHLRLAVFLDFCLVILFYACILLTSVYAFEPNVVQDLYTLTFTHPAFFKYMLELFPVLTLAANFPIIAIVLKDNIKRLFLTKDECEYGIFLRRILFPLVTITPPIVVSYCTYDVGLLVGYTGAYAGAIIQYVIPVMLVYSARKKAIATFGEYDNRYTSPLRHVIWLVLVILWYLITLVFVTYAKINGFQGGA